MSSPPLKSSLPKNICSVKPIQLSFHLELAQPVIHHNLRGTNSGIIEKYRSTDTVRPYGVSSSRRVLSPQLLFKKFDLVRDCLESPLGLSLGEREAMLRLLRLWAYYGKVYPKASGICEEPGCSKATYWRTIRKLRDRGLLQVINRYIIRPHAQISNRYLFNKLLVIIARYLAEHGTKFKERWLQPFVSMSGHQFWGQVFQPLGLQIPPGGIPPPNA